MVAKTVQEIKAYEEDKRFTLFRSEGYEYKYLFHIGVKDNAGAVQYFELYFGRLSYDCFKELCKLELERLKSFLEEEPEFFSAIVKYLLCLTTVWLKRDFCV